MIQFSKVDSTSEETSENGEVDKDVVVAKHVHSHLHDEEHSSGCQHTRSHDHGFGHSHGHNHSFGHGHGHGHGQFGTGDWSTIDGGHIKGDSEVKVGHRRQVIGILVRIAVQYLCFTTII